MVNKRIIAINGPLSLILDDENTAQGHVEGEDGFVGPTHSIYSVLARPGWQLVPNHKIIIPIAIKGGPGSGNYAHAGRPGLVGGSSTAGGTAFAGVGFKPGGLNPNKEYAKESNTNANTFLSAGLPNATGFLSSSYTGWSAATTGTRSAIKAGICVDLAGRTGLYQAEVNELIEQWSKTSNDNDMRAFALQMAAAEELGIELSPWQQGSIDAVAAEAEEVASKMAWEMFDKPTEEDYQLVLEQLYSVNPGLGAPTQQTMDNNKAIIRAMYDNTQAALKDAGFQPDDTIRLYRGFHRSAESVGDWKPGDIVDYQGNAIESWSVSRDSAAVFGRTQGEKQGIVVAMDIPVRNIVGSARTGFGCLTEGEFVIAGNIPGSQARVEGVSVPQRNVQLFSVPKPGEMGMHYQHEWYQEGS